MWRKPDQLKTSIVVPLSQDQALDHDQRPQPAVAASHETHKLLKLGGAVEVENMV